MLNGGHILVNKIAGNRGFLGDIEADRGGLLRRILQQYDTPPAPARQPAAAIRHNFPVDPENPVILSF